MPGLDPGIQRSVDIFRIAGSSPAMTISYCSIFCAIRAMSDFPLACFLRSAMMEALYLQ